MRTYKFRGKRIDNGKWIYGSLIIEPYLPEFKSMQFDIENTDKSKYLIYSFDPEKGRAKEVIPETVGQCVALQDSEGFEGDIIEFQYVVGYRKLVTVKGVIKFGKYFTASNCGEDFYALGFYVEQIDRCEGQEWNMYDSEIQKGNIIGNITDNPELTKEAK